MGFLFTEDKVKETIKRKKPKRKTGKRPQNIRTKRKLT